MEKELKKEILSLNNSDWVYANLHIMIEAGMKMLESGEAKNVEHAAFRVIDSYY